MYWSQYGLIDGTWKYRGDMGITDSDKPFTVAFDGVLFADGNGRYWQTVSYISYFLPDAPTATYADGSMYFTIDMGRNASYSRMRYFMRARNPLYSGPAMTKFTIWGTNNPKAINEIGDGSQLANLKYWTNWSDVGGTEAWKNDWEKIADCNLVLPSGVISNVNTSILTSEDLDFIRAGFNFEMDPSMSLKPFRYLRFDTTESNNGMFVQMCEIEFWGAYPEE
jgi:hypothetical protein